MLDGVGGLHFFLSFYILRVPVWRICFIRFLYLALGSVLWVRLLPFGGVGCFTRV